MGDERCRLDHEDVVIALDWASAEHQVVVLTAAGQRLTRFRIPHSRAALDGPLRRTAPAALGRAGGRRMFAFESTGHVWEAVAYLLRARGDWYVIVNPLATYRVREARQLSREKTDHSDAEQIAEFGRTGLVARTQLEARPYLALRHARGEYRRLRDDRARLNVLVAYAEFLGVSPDFHPTFTVVNANKEVRNRAVERYLRDPPAVGRRLARCCWRCRRASEPRRHCAASMPL